MPNPVQELRDLLKFAQARNKQVLEIQATMGDMLNIVSANPVDSNSGQYISIHGIPYRIGPRILLVCKE